MSVITRTIRGFIYVVIVLTLFVLISLGAGYLISLAPAIDWAPWTPYLTAFAVVALIAYILIVSYLVGDGL